MQGTIQQYAQCTQRGHVECCTIAFILYILSVVLPSGLLIKATYMCIGYKQTILPTPEFARFQGGCTYMYIILYLYAHALNNECNYSGNRAGMH